jgi:hypothetical protein
MPTSTTPAGYALRAQHQQCNAPPQNKPPHSQLLALNSIPHCPLRDPAPVKPLLQAPQPRKKYIIIHIRALKPPLTLGRIKRSPRMQHPPIIKNHTLALIQPVLEQILLSTEQLLIRLAGRHEAPEGGLCVTPDARFEGGLEGRTPVYAANGEVGGVGVFVLGEEFDDGAGEVVVVGWVVVVVRHREGAEGAEVQRGEALELVHGVEGVAEERFTPRSTRAQRVQQLQVWWV